MTFPENIKNLRLKNGLTQEEFGKMVGVNSRSVSKWECGLGMPRPKALAAICEQFRIDHNVLLGLEDSPVSTEISTVYYDMLFQTRPELKDLLDAGMKANNAKIEEAIKLLKE